MQVECEGRYIKSSGCSTEVEFRRCWVEQIAHCFAERFEVDRFCYVAVEASLHTFFKNVCHDICGQGNDWHAWIEFLRLPIADFATGLVAVLARHVEITL